MKTSTCQEKPRATAHLGRERLTSFITSFARLLGCASLVIDGEGSPLVEPVGDESLIERLAESGGLAIEMASLRAVSPTESSLRRTSIGLVISIVPIRCREDAIAYWLAIFDAARGDLDLQVEHQQQCARQLATIAFERVELSRRERRAREIREDLHRSREALADSNRMFQSILDTIPVRVFWKDTDSRFLGCNRLFARDAGFERPEELIGKTDADLCWRSEAELYRADDRRIMETRQRFIDYEEPQTTPEGKTLWLQTSKIPLSNAQGEVIGVLGTYSDITRRKRAEEELQRLLGDLKTKNDELERFTYTVSHDLKSPLVTIRGFLGVLRRDLKKGCHGRLADSLDRIDHASERMAGLLDELLEMSRIGRVEEPWIELSLRSLVDEAVRLCSGRLQGGRIDLRIAPALPKIRGDRTRIVQVLQNLIDNACKYMGDQPYPWIAVEAHNHGEINEVIVRDNGIGIEPKYHDLVFGLFDKLDPQTEGNGIGLALVQRIIESHGGEIRVESEGAGRGSTFRFTLPAALPPAMPTALPPAAVPQDDVA